MEGAGVDKSANKYAAADRRQDRLTAARKVAVHSDREWFAMCLVVQGCARCGEKKIGKDHVIPLCRGGSDGIDNIQPLCVWCNRWKSVCRYDFRPVEWKEKIKALLDFSDSLRTLD
jgi:5-methylcytosine-specific restriction endonuclease McrA